MRVKIPDTLITRDVLKDVTEQILSDLVSRSTLDEKVIEDYADLLISLAERHTKQGSPENPD